MVSFAGDLMKSSIYAKAGLLDSQSLVFAGLCVPVMIASSLTGRYLNRRVGEKGFAILFWTVMAGYACRLAL